tara:strand:- start:4852 stop:5619 length:768 start_codon:yes stop_codon:yes gene_type:complete
MNKTKKILPKNNIFSIYGLNGTKNILNQKKIKIIFVDLMIGGKAEKSNKIINKIQKIKSKIRRLPKQQFLKKYKSKRTQGIVIHFKGNFVTSLPNFSKFSNKFCLLTLDNLEDPQNLGQIIRTSECAGIDGIIIPSNKSVQLTESVFQVSQGAFLNIPIFICKNLKNEIIKLKQKGLFIVGLENSIKALPWYEINFLKPTLIVIGSEGFGIRKEILNICNIKATIPMSGKINSLNVGSAASAILFERQRQLLKIN